MRGEPTLALPTKISQLIATFEAHREATYSSKQYNETLLRDDFLDDFFGELGWDLKNSKGLSHAYRDVIKEEAVATKDGVKAPDFTFRIGGTRRFFVEAKRPLLSIKDSAAAAYQLRRYAWSAKLPLSILTSFQEFAVYDGRIRPSKGDSASKGRIFYCKFDELEENWEWIEQTFSRDAVLAGSLDRWVEEHNAGRGRSEVDDDFLETIEAWRSDLAKNIALRNSDLTARDINFSVQRVIDRIIFLRICEDRGIEDYASLRALLAKQDLYEGLCGLFEDADAKYNSGLFHFKEEKGREGNVDTLTPGLTIDDAKLKPIIRGLYYPDSPYEFSVLPADILGQVYEQFLGKVIRLTPSHRAVVEFKPEVKKSGGVYYTPTYIVDFIVGQTLGVLIDGKSPAQIRDVTVMDPACGSGSFLIGAYQYLLDWYLAHYVQNPKKWTKGPTPVLIETSSTEWRLTLAERKRILLRHIYGVDIDYQAVEVTKLSLLLKVLEGETEQTLQPTLRGLGERALPNLGSNIKCGNSLIGPEFYDSGLLPLEGLFPEKINVFDWEGEDGFASIMSSGGFRVVIGNPPYIFAREQLTEEEKAYFSRHYKLAWEKHNTYLLFMEALPKMLSKKGLGAYIVPNSWLTIESAKKIRGAYIDKIREIVDLNYSAFKKVSMEPTIFIIEGGASKSSPKVSRASSRLEFDTRTINQANRNEWRKNAGRITFSKSGNRPELDALKARLKTVGDHFDVRTGLQAYEKGKGTPAQTASDVKNHVFDADRKVDATTYRYLQGRDVGAFSLNWSNSWMRYGPWLSQPREISQFTRPRVLLREITSPFPYCLSACFTDEIFLSNKSTLTILDPGDDPRSLKALACVINSSLMSVFYKEYGVKSARRLFPKVLIRNLREFPFPSKFEPKLVNRLSDLYDQFVAAKLAHEKAQPHRRDVTRRIVDATRSKIDAVAMELYGLSADEVDLVKAIAQPSSAREA